MEFFSRSNKPPRHEQSFSEYEPVYKMFIDKNGKEEIKQVGQTNIYEKIQQYKDECDIYKILERYEHGDINAINKVAGTYADIRNSPKTLAEAQQIIIDAKNDFENLPKELKKEFNNNANEFIAKISDGSANEIFAKYNKQKNGEIKPQNNENNNSEQNNNMNNNNETNVNNQPEGVKYE